MLNMCYIQNVSVKKANTEMCNYTIKTNCEFQMHLRFQDSGVDILCFVKVSCIKSFERVCHFMSVA